MKIFEEVKDIIAANMRMEMYYIQYLAIKADVAPSTLYFWLDGTTKCPRLDTIVRVAKALGCEVVLERSVRKLRRAA